MDSVEGVSLSSLIILLMQLDQNAGNYIFDDLNFKISWQSMHLNPRGVLPIMDYTGRIRPKGVPFQAGGKLRVGI